MAVTLAEALLEKIKFVRTEVLDAYKAIGAAGQPATRLVIQPAIDAGRTMFGGTNTLTCIAPGPDDSDRLDSITGNLRLI